MTAIAAEANVGNHWRAADEKVIMSPVRRPSLQSFLAEVPIATAVPAKAMKKAAAPATLPMLTWPQACSTGRIGASCEEEASVPAGVHGQVGNEVVAPARPGGFRLRRTPPYAINHHHHAAVGQRVDRLPSKQDSMGFESPRQLHGLPATRSDSSRREMRY